MIGRTGAVLVDRSDRYRASGWVRQVPSQWKGQTGTMLMIDQTDSMLVDGSDICRASERVKQSPC